MGPQRGLGLVVLVAACHPSPPPAALTPPRPPAPAATADAPPIGRLDDRARPVAATVELEVDPRAAGVRGRVVIDLAITRPLRVIWLHARDLELLDAEVVTGGVTQPARVIVDSSPSHTEGQGDLVGLTVDRPLMPGPARLAVRYRAPWGEDAGLVRTLGPTPMAVTDLSPADARSVMPCFDDPRFKISWTLALTIPADLAAFANYPERARQPAGAGRIRVEFAPTRPLPAHLVAFTVGALVAVEAGPGLVPIRIITPPGTEPLMAHAASVLPGLLTALADYVDEPVPFPKLDVVAVPALSGSVVGMENPGLITMRSDSLMIEPGAPPWMRVAVTATLTHELAHLWFGDLVSLAWWDEFWLNEGFASWLTDKVMLARDPDWSLVDHPFAPWALMPGDRPGTGAVRRRVDAPEDYPAILDLKAYARGAAVVATLEAWLGADRFRALVRTWIDRHRDGSVTTALLVDAVADALADDRGGDQPPTPATLATMMAGLVDHAGVPEARFTIRCGPAAPPRIEVVVSHGPAAAPWPLPVCARVDGEAAPRCALVTGRGDLTLDRGCPRWLVPNPGGRAYYRPLLASGLLAAALTRGGATADERAMLLRAVTDADPPRSVDDRLQAAVACDRDRLAWCRGHHTPWLRALATATRAATTITRAVAAVASGAAPATDAEATDAADLDRPRLPGPAVRGTSAP